MPRPVIDMPPLREGDQVLAQDMYKCRWFRAVIVCKNENGTYDLKYLDGGCSTNYSERNIRAHYLFTMNGRKDSGLNKLYSDLYVKPEDRNVNINKEDIAIEFLEDLCKRCFAIEYYGLERNIYYNYNDLHNILVNRDDIYIMASDFYIRCVYIHNYRMQQREKDILHLAKQMKYKEKQIMSAQHTKLATVMSIWGDRNNIHIRTAIRDVLLEMPQYLQDN